MNVTGCAVRFNYGYRIDPHEFTDEYMGNHPPPADVAGSPHPAFLKGRVEVIHHPRCFDHDNFVNVKLLLDHDAAAIASVNAGTLRIERRVDGLYFTASIEPDSPFAQMFREGTISGTSPQTTSVVSAWVPPERDHRKLIFLKARLDHIGCAIAPDLPRGAEHHRIYLESQKHGS